MVFSKVSVIHVIPCLVAGQIYQCFGTIDCFLVLPDKNLYKGSTSRMRIFGIKFFGFVQDGTGIDVDGLFTTVQGKFVERRPLMVDTELDNSVSIFFPLIQYNFNVIKFFVLRLCFVNLKKSGIRH